ncbi:glycosyltransferase [Kaistia soli]|nr:glycosyltransferase [Kaistia soli]
MASGIVVISDFVDRSHGAEASSSTLPATVAPTVHRDVLRVVGGYLERLPRAAIRAGYVDFAEIWDWSDRAASRAHPTDDPFLTRRRFRLDDDRPPFHSDDAVEFIRKFGAPAIICIWGLGVSEQILEACRDSIIVYNSIDAPPLRVPDAVARHFDLVLTGAQWQSDEIAARLPGMPTEILPIGPEFAAPEMFFPIAGEKHYDIVYVAAAQPYKRHDILFDALERAPRRLRALCVMGYGELGDALRLEAASRCLDVDFIGPPGVTHDEVNRLMNQARIGVVCGIDDGAPAILTEYMLAGLPVVANSRLKCGLQYILPETGIVSDSETFHSGILQALDRLAEFTPRKTVIERWSWPHSIQRLDAYFRREPGASPAIKRSLR